jgi:uncharacterized PurR-regulated membrane protein YhhQ (DUF165 family)
MQPSNETILIRRERVFLILAGIFLCAMTMLNLLGITRFVELGPWTLAVGVLPYPITFLCTDLISELYGRRRANFLVTFGLCLNLFILGFMWLGDALPAAATQAPWQTLNLADPVGLPNGDTVQGEVELFALLYATTSGAVLASMLAYFAAQYCDVFMFHFWKNLTQGRHLWLRNNGSTIISQGVDSFMVVAVTFGAQFLAGAMSAATLFSLMTSNYLFKLTVALLDTLPLYLCVHYLRPYLGIEEGEVGYGLGEHSSDP